MAFAYNRFRMHMLSAIAVSVFAWMLVVGILFVLLYKEKIDSTEGNMAFCFFLQAAVPVFIFWWFTHRPGF